MIKPYKLTMVNVVKSALQAWDKGILQAQQTCGNGGGCQYYTPGNGDHLTCCVIGAALPLSLAKRLAANGRNTSVITKINNAYVTISHYELTAMRNLQNLHDRAAQSPDIYHLNEFRRELLLLKKEYQV